MKKGSLPNFLPALHNRTAVWIEQLDRILGGKVWHNYWDARLTFERSYPARLGYGHQNAVRHGWVAVANLYPWCWAGCFERMATTAQVKTIYRFKVDLARVLDDCDVAVDW